MYKTLGFKWLLKVFCPASAFVTADRDEARNPQRFIHVTVSRQCKKTTTQQTICYLKTEKEKRYNEQPTHKTAHLQAPTHKPMLRLAKEQFSCRRTAGN